jgi:hypothetical protein
LKFESHKIFSIYKSERYCWINGFVLCNIPELFRNKLIKEPEFFDLLFTTPMAQNTGKKIRFKKLSCSGCYLKPGK